MQININPLRAIVAIGMMQIVSSTSNKFSENDSPEMMYRKTAQSWQLSSASRSDYQVWIDFTQSLISMFDDEEKNRLPMVEAIEEGILKIERATVALGEGVDKQRDGALSEMYTIYGKMLSKLNPNECHALALDPHTLLIGVEQITQSDDPSTYLCIENAENALRNGITLDAANIEAQDLLTNILGENGSDSVHNRKPKEFIAELFDSFADTFDEKLNNLQYKVPELVGEVVQHISAKRDPPSFNTILDAGCGTGLAGRFLRSHLTTDGVMIGVDASQKMLDVAAKCTIHSGCGIDLNHENVAKLGINDDQPLYDSLLQMDLEDMTIENTFQDIDDAKNIIDFEMITAADVLVYFGSLENILKVYSELSVPGAILIFTCEKAIEEEAPLGWRLLSSGRFAHTKEHVLKYASSVGYDLSLCKEIVPRMERGEEVLGHIFCFVLSDNQHTDHNEL